MPYMLTLMGIAAEYPYILDPPDVGSEIIVFLMIYHMYTIKRSNISTIFVTKIGLLAGSIVRNLLVNFCCTRRYSDLTRGGYRSRILVHMIQTIPVGV